MKNRWKSINSAPTDGSRIYGYCLTGRNTIVTMKYCKHGFGYWRSSYGTNIYDPVYWMEIKEEDQKLIEDAPTDKTPILAISTWIDWSYIVYYGTSPNISGAMYEEKWRSTDSEHTVNPFKKWQELPAPPSALRLSIRELVKKYGFSKEITYV